MIIDTPKVISVGRQVASMKPRRWATHITFDNGVILKFAGRWNDSEASFQATKQYRHMLEAGFTDAQIVGLFGGSK